MSSILMPKTRNPQQENNGKKLFKGINLPPKALPTQPDYIYLDLLKHLHCNVQYL